MGPLAIIALGGVIYYVYEKDKNPAWSPFTRLLSTPVDKVVALEKVKVTSVPTPSPTVALDPNMTTDQVKQVNRTLSSETDPKKIAAHAIALGVAGHDNSALALAAKASAVGEAKATGASDVDIHSKQIEAARATDAGHVPVPLDAPMSACEAQVLLNVLTSRQGHFDVEGIPVPLPITNAFDADTSHLIRVFQAEVHLPATGTMDVDTATALRLEALGPAASHAGAVAAGWGPVASGSGGPIATGFYGHPFGGRNFDGWSQPWEHGYRPWRDEWAGWPWHHHYGWRGFAGYDVIHGRERGHEGGFAHGHEEFGRGREQFGRGREQFGRGREQFGRGRELFGRGRESFGEYAPQPQYAEEMPMPMHHHRRHLSAEQLLQQQQAEQMQQMQMQQVPPPHPHHHHHHHHHHHPQAMPPQDPMAAHETAPPAGMPIGGGGGAAAMAAPLTADPNHTPDVSTSAAATTTQGWWFPDQPGSYGHDPLGLYGYDPGFGYEPGSLGRDPYWGSNSGFGGYGSIGFGGPEGLGGYGSWGSFGGWGHGL